MAWHGLAAPVAAGPGNRVPDASASHAGALRHGAAGPDADPGRRQPADAGTGQEAVSCLDFIKKLALGFRTL